MKKQIAVLIIDPQNDFCHPEGSLFVEGSIEDNERLSKWIVDNKDEINYIGCTLDSHQLIDIAHPRYWVDKNGNNPGAFTVISASDVENGTVCSQKSIVCIPKGTLWTVIEIVFMNGVVTGTLPSSISNFVNLEILLNDI